MHTTIHQSTYRTPRIGAPGLAGHPPAFEANLPEASSVSAALLTRQEAAAYIGVQPNTLATWACTQRYDLPYVKVGRNVRYRKQDLDAFIHRNLHGTSFDAIAAEGANV